MLEAARAIPPVENTKYRLALTDVDYEGPETHSLKRQKKALLSGESLYRKLKGTWTMTDLEGNVVSQQRAQLARIPFMSDRGTFIIGGNEQSFAHQFRLKPGAYTRQQQSGLFETAVNPRKGSSHKVFLDPETGVFQLAMGQAKIPLLPLMQAMGVSNQTLRDNWGDELVNANNRKSDPQAIGKLYKKLFPSGKRLEGVAPEDLGQTMREAVVSRFSQMELDPEVATSTLGRPHTNLTADAYLDITKKLLAVSRLEAQPDDRDSMPYQTLQGPEDLIAERVTRAKNTLNKLLWKSTYKGTLGSYVGNALDDDVRGAWMTSGLSAPMEETNLAEVLDHSSRVTRMGEGGTEDELISLFLQKSASQIYGYTMTIYFEVVCASNKLVHRSSKVILA